MYESTWPYEGVPVGSQVVLYDDFITPITAHTADAAVMNSAVPWNFSIVNSSTLTDVNVAGATGCARITNGNADDDDSDLASALCFYAACEPTIEVRAANNDVDQLAHCIGFSDAISEGANTIAFTYSLAALTSTATDGACFLHDPDATTDAIYCVSVNNDTDGTTTTSGSAAADGTFNTYRIHIDSAGNAYFYLDGSLVYTEALAVATSAILCAYVAVIEHPSAGAAEDTFDIDYIRVWAKRKTS